MNNASKLGHRHTIHAHQHHFHWDNSVKPALTVAPGDTIAFEKIDSTDGQITPKTVAADVPQLDFGRVNPISGPVYVDGAVPGDALKVTMVGVESPGWGWTGVVPGFGLLAEDFPNPALVHWTYDTSFKVPAMYGPGGRVPLKPFCGTIGVAPAEKGAFSTIPPLPTGGNVDTRDLGLGVDIYFPVAVKGALFSVGDSHAAQGDGEVCGTAIESPFSVVYKFDLVKGANLRFPRFQTHEPVTRHLDAKGYDATMGVGSDLMRCAKDAVRGMIDLLGKRHGLSAENAYMLCSVCGDLRISEIVDQPNWVVSFYFPRVVLE
ncbi:MAG: acetamidase [Alphaproteobacteria bacterium]|nr:acetamidase [Alphaproteobacteria bacterium]